MHDAKSVNRIDIIRSDAPSLAPYGKFQIGVRTLEWMDTDRVDVLNTQDSTPSLLYDRYLTAEIWYPASVTKREPEDDLYQAITRNPAITATLAGRAVRDATPLMGAGKFPLIIISHGYPGNRYLMSHLGENLASKGFVTVSIDHTDSTYDDQKAIASTLYNRPIDQRFVIDQVAELAADESSFLFGLADAQNTGVVGYSMGGYGLLANLGGGLSKAVVEAPTAPPNKLLNIHAASNPQYLDNLDSRIKAGFAVAPWGMAHGVWEPEDLAGIQIPTLYLAGDADTVSGYTTGVRAIYDAAINSERYLLTYKNAGHNAGAPMPLPREIRDSDSDQGADHYIDPVWDNVRMNNVMTHFATAYFSRYLKADASMLTYLNVHPDGATAAYSANPGQTHWPGFAEGTAVGLMLERLAPGESG